MDAVHLALSGSAAPSSSSPTTVGVGVQERERERKRERERERETVCMRVRERKRLQRWKPSAVGVRCKTPLLDPRFTPSTSGRGFRVQGPGTSGFGFRGYGFCSNLGFMALDSGLRTQG